MVLDEITFCFLADDDIHHGVFPLFGFAAIIVIRIELGCIINKWIQPANRNEIV